MQDLVEVLQASIFSMKASISSMKASIFYSNSVGAWKSRCCMLVGIGDRALKQEQKHAPLGGIKEL